MALWPRPAAPVAWLAADGDDAAIVSANQEIVLKPGARQYATQLWAQRRGFTLPDGLEAAMQLQQANFDCSRMGCAPLGPGRPAIAAWWTKRKPAAGKLESLCAHADIFILRAEVPVPDACRGAILLRNADFAAGGAAEVFASPGGWRIAWSQPERGERPWSFSDTGG